MAANPQRRANSDRTALDGRLAKYLAATGAVSVGLLTAAAQGVIVSNHTVQPFGVNGAVSIDMNGDGQTDFQIDHDRVTLPSGGPTLDFLQIDKNDINGESNPLAFDPGPDCCFQATPFSDGATARNDANESAYLINGPQGSYPAALTEGALIGPLSTFDFAESSNFQGGGKDIRANRLIDEDATQIDQILGGQPVSGVYVPTNGPNFLGLGGEVRYLGVKMDLNNAGLINYGWIGIRILNDADATGEVVGFGYETTAGAPILAGASAVVPEPGSFFVLTVLTGGLFCSRVRRNRDVV